MRKLFVLAFTAAACGGAPPPQKPTIYQQPFGGTFVECSTVHMSVDATGPGTLRYQWFKDGNAIPLATDPILTLDTTSAADAGGYYVSISNDAGSISSNTIYVDITAAPFDPGPTTIVKSSAGDILVLDDLIVWGTGNGIATTPIRCPGKADFVFYGAREPSSLTAINGHVAWIDAMPSTQGIYRTDPRSGSTEQFLPASTFEAGGFIVVDTNFVWTETQPPAVAWMSTTGGNVTTWPIDVGIPAGLVAAAGNLYLTDSKNSAVERMPIGGGALETLATDQGFVYRLATDGSYVYWVSTFGSDPQTMRAILNRMNLDGSNPIVLASQQPGSAEDLLVYDGYVYWTVDPAVSEGVSAGVGSVYRVRADGSAPAETLVTGLTAQPLRLAIASPWLYWTQYPDEIVRMALPQ